MRSDFQPGKENLHSTAIPNVRLIKHEFGDGKGAFINNTQNVDLSVVGCILVCYLVSILRLCCEKRLNLQFTTLPSGTLLIIFTYTNIYKYSGMANIHASTTHRCQTLPKDTFYSLVKVSDKVEQVAPANMASYSTLYGFVFMSVSYSNFHVNSAVADEPDCTQS